MLYNHLNDFHGSSNFQIESEVEFSSEGLDFKFIISPGNLVKLPPLKKTSFRERRDHLWQESCFELFWTVDEISYWEMNLAPTGDWQLYFFSDYRQAPSEEEAQISRLVDSTESNRWSIGGRLVSENISFEKVSLYNPTVILKNQEECTYFAHKHPSAMPDFHLRDCWLKI